MNKPGIWEAVSMGLAHLIGALIAWLLALLLFGIALWALLILNSIILKIIIVGGVLLIMLYLVGYNDITSKEKK